MTFGQKLKRYREEKGLTQEMLAEMLGTYKQNICRFEKSDAMPKLDTIQKYAEKLGLPVNYLSNNNIVTENGLDLSDVSVQKSLWRYIDVDEFGTLVLIFNGLCDGENVKSATDMEETENQKYKKLLEELRKHPLSREEVTIITELRKQQELKVAVKRILGMED